MKKVQLILLLVITALFITTFSPSTAVMAQEDKTASVIPTLKAPIGTIITTTPTYTWTEDNGRCELPVPGLPGDHTKWWISTFTEQSAVHPLVRKPRTIHWDSMFINGASAQ